VVIPSKTKVATRSSIRSSSEMMMWYFQLLRKPTSIPNDALKSTSTCNHKQTDSCFHYSDQSTARMHPLADLRHITTSSLCRRAPKVPKVDRFRGPRTRVLVRRTVRTASKIKRAQEQSSEDQTLPNVFYLFQTIEEVLCYWSFETLDPCDPLPDLARSSRAPFHQVS
jgi:hypothetical protein